MLDWQVNYRRCKAAHSDRNQRNIHSLGMLSESSWHLLLGIIWGYESYNAWHWESQDKCSVRLPGNDRFTSKHECMKQEKKHLSSLKSKCILPLERVLCSFLHPHLHMWPLPHGCLDLTRQFYYFFCHLHCEVQMYLRGTSSTVFMPGIKVHPHLYKGIHLAVNAVWTSESRNKQYLLD